MKFTIKLKLALAFAVLLILLLGMAIYGIRSLGGINDTMGATIDGPVARLSYAQGINIAQLEGIRQQKNIIGADNPSQIEQAQKKGDAARVVLRETLDKALAIASEQGRPRWLKIQELSIKADAIDDKIRGLMLAGQAAEAERLSITEAREVAGEMYKSFDELITLSQQKLEEADAAGDTTY